MRTLLRLVQGMLIMVLAASCNGEARQRELRASRADSVIFDIGTTKDYERMRAQADSDAKALKEQSMHDQAARRYEEGLEAIKAGIAEVWEFVNSIVEFNRYTNSPIANYKGKQYNMPFNMNTFYQMWGVLTPDEARQKIEEQKAEAVAAMKAAGVTEPRNLEEQALMLIGKDIYEALIKGYTEKQWGRKCTELPAFIIKRLPVRFIHDNDYFNDKYQGIPIGGYNKLIDGLLEGVETRTDIDFFKSHTDLTDPTDDAKG